MVGPGRGMKLEPAPALVFRGIHGLIGMSQKFVDILVVQWVQGDSDTRADRDTMRAEYQRACQSTPQFEFATTATSASPEMPSRIAVNSSPPMRATVSTSRTHSVSRVATTFSS